MKRQSILVIALIGVLVGGGIWWYTTQYTPKPKPATNTTVNQNTNTVVELPTKVTYKGVEGKNALELLKESHQVIEDNGFVQAIDGRPNSKSTYWFLYVNDKSSDVGAKDVKTTASDTIEWRFEEYVPE